MRRPDAPTVVVMGVAGCGKSTVGALLARALNIRFVDADNLQPFSNKNKMSAGISLNDVDRDPWLERVGVALAQGESWCPGHQLLVFTMS